MTASLVDNGAVSGCISDISSGTFDVSVTINEKVVDNTVQVDLDPSKIISSLKSTAEIP